MSLASISAKADAETGDADETAIFMEMVVRNIIKMQRETVLKSILKVG